MRTLSLLVGLGALTMAAACSSGPYCERTSKCSAEPKPNVMACQDNLKKYGNCAKQQEAWLNCAYDHEVCTMDNKSDPTATLGYANSHCKSQKQELEACSLSDGGAQK